jgi:hypothetical protein
MLGLPDLGTGPKSSTIDRHLAARVAGHAVQQQIWAPKTHGLGLALVAGILITRAARARSPSARRYRIVQPGVPLHRVEFDLSPAAFWEKVYDADAERSPREGRSW